MSWDIYGNPLRRGYCEVHPDVHQEYPCSICMAQKQQQSQPHNELEQLQYEFAQQGDYIRHLESERAALAAKVEALRDAAEDAAESLGFLSHHLRGRMGEAALMDMAEKADALNEALKATPQHHLRELRAEAGRAGFVAGYEFCLSTLPSPYCNLIAVNYKGMAERYADSIRQGVK